MKRREFLVASAGVAGALPLVGLGRPCPPPTVSLGSQSATTACTNPTEIQDWINRSTGAGVVWAHNFASASEVNQFRYTNGHGNDPTQSLGGTNVVWNSTDGFAGGGCLEIDIPSGSHGANASWQRPFSALHAGQPSGGGTGNGLTADDPAAGGTLPVQTWNSASTSEMFYWRKGYCVNPTIQAHFNNVWPAAGNTGVFDTNSFYLQFRVKIPSSRWTAGNPAGKLILIEPAGQWSDLQELVIRSAPRTGDLTGFTYSTSNPFMTYTSRGGYTNSVIDATQGAGNQNYSSGTSIEPGGPYAATCTWGGAKTVGNCWEFPPDQWATILLQLIPGQDNSNYTGNPPAGNSGTWPFQDTVLNVWVCPQGATSYTQIFAKNNLAWFYYTDSGAQYGYQDGSNGMFHPPAFNALEFSGYMNNVLCPTGWSHKFTQIIFSTQFIPCPVA